MPSHDIQRRTPLLLKQLGVAACYALLAHLDHLYFESGTAVSSFEAASGFALAVLLIGDKRYAWGVFLGGLLENMAANSLGTSVAIASGHALEALCGAWLLTYDYRFERSLRDYLQLILKGGAVSAGVGANIGVAALLALGFIPPESFPHELIHWWTGDVLGIALVTPLILVFYQTKNNWRESKQIAEAVLLLGLTFLAGQIIFLGWIHGSLGNMAQGYMMFLFITLVAVRLEVRGTVIAMVTTAIQSTLSAFHGVGYFADDIAQSHLVNYWFYTLTLSIVGMALAMFISECKRAEEELKRFFDLVPDMVCIVSDDGYLKKINRAWQAELGFTEQEILSIPFLDFIHPDDREATLKEIERRLGGGGPSLFCNRYRCRDGSYKLLEWETSPPVNGKLLYGSARDITERKLIEKELLENKKKLQATLDAIPDLLFEVGLDGYIYDYHSPRTDLLAAPPEIFLGKIFSDVLPPPVTQVCLSALQEAHEKGISTGKQYELSLPQGKRWFELSVSGKAADAGQQPRFIFLARDITGRKATEQQLRDLSMHMLEVREEEKASIAREIHDELGGTLTALKMDAYWLSRKLPASEETRGVIERTKMMLQRIDNAVSVTRRIITDLRPTLIDDLGLLPALEWQAAEFRKHTGIECRVNCIENEGTLDKPRSIALFRILQEALTNVSRHSGASRVEVEFHQSEKETILMVNDNGHGITENSLATIKSYGMLGMTERVKQLNGRIIFGSPPGGGFSVTVILPLPAGSNQGGEA